MSVKLSELYGGVDGTALIVIMTLLKEGFDTVATLAKVQMNRTEAQQTTSTATTSIITVLKVLPAPIIRAAIGQGLAPR